jgi:catechol 2,3-dioxygenase-like lactoylglutathione lyase family enzyme
VECRSITLYSNDWRACRRFYVDFLGLGVVAEGEDQFLALEGSPLCIDAAHGRPASSGFVLFAADDLNALRRRAETMGYQVQREDDSGLHLRDPDGREVQIYRDNAGGS